jgi:hypothetical protein
MNNDREYMRQPPLSDWLQLFADQQLKTNNSSDGVQSLFKKKNDFNAVEAMVQDLRQRVGLDLINEETVKTASIVVEDEQNAVDVHGGPPTIYGLIKSLNDDNLLLFKDKTMERIYSLTENINKFPNNFKKVKEWEITREKAEKLYDDIKKELDKRRVFFQSADDKLEGGLGDGKKDKDVDKKQLEMGIEVEKEHTPDLQTRKEIAKDHLTENDNYYTYLDNMEKKMDSEEKKASFVVFLTSIANQYEDIGNIKMATRIDHLICKVAKEEKDKDDSIFEKHPSMKKFIEKMLTSRGGFMDTPALLEEVCKVLKDIAPGFKLKEKFKEEILEYVKEVKKEKTKSKEDGFSGSTLVLNISDLNENEDMFKR